jgi:hypothetical protein
MEPWIGGEPIVSFVSAIVEIFYATDKLMARVSTLKERRF